MKRSEIVAAFRNRIDDEVAPYLWSDPEVWRYLDDAHREAATRAHLIRDSRSALCHLDVVAPQVALDFVVSESLALVAPQAAAVLVVDATSDVDSINAMAAVTLQIGAVMTSAALARTEPSRPNVEALVASAAALVSVIEDTVVLVALTSDAPAIAAVDGMRVLALAFQVNVLTAQTIVASVGDIGLSPLVLDVLRARVESQSEPLEIVSVEQMDEDDPLWQMRNVGTPYRLVTERVGAGLTARLFPIPYKNERVLLTVTRLPLTNLNTDDDEPEIPLQYHERLVDWMMRDAYLKKDSETLDEDASLKAEARFEATFGVFLDANVVRKQADRRTNRVQFQGF